MRYVAPPCNCLLCQEADVTTLDQRFVPDSEGGHWAHGQELRRWYDAMHTCIEQLRAMPKGSASRAALQLVVTRDPGQEG